MECWLNIGLTGSRSLPESRMSIFPLPKEEIGLSISYVQQVLREDQLTVARVGGGESVRSMILLLPTSRSIDGAFCLPGCSSSVRSLAIIFHDVES